MKTDNRNGYAQDNLSSMSNAKWLQFLDQGGNQPRQLGEGNYYIGTLIDAEDVETPVGGPTGHYARLTFDIEGVHLQFTATLPSRHIQFDACKKLRRALMALRWDGNQTLPSLIGRHCWCQIGTNKRGHEIVDDVWGILEEGNTP